MAGKFELRKAKDGQVFFNLKAANGEVILTSEMYKSRAGALNGIESVKKNSAIASRFAKKSNKTGKPYFVLTAANHQVIGQSEAYDSDKACDRGIASVMKSAPKATLSDVTG
jgi:hypothetical protein